MDLVTRDEFDAVKAMAIEARTENERLAKRLGALEASFERRGKGARGAGKTSRKGAKAGAAASGEGA